MVFERLEQQIIPERLKRFFERESGGYRIRKEVRERVVFAPHNLLGDPPFSKLDLIVCRNVMIYVQRDVQRDVIDLFHYSLLPEGTLVLGTSETIDSSDLFRIDEKKLSIYRRRDVPAPEPRLPVFPLSRSGRTLRQSVRAVSPPQEYRTLHHAIVDRCGPPSLLVSPDDKAVYVTELAGRYLSVPGGEITQNIFKLVHEELRMDLRGVVHDARKHASVQRSRAIPSLVTPICWLKASPAPSTPQALKRSVATAASCWKLSTTFWIYPRLTPVKCRSISNEYDWTCSSAT